MKVCHGSAHYATVFDTGKRCSKKKNSTTNVYETNLRSMYASQTMGRAGLVNFCNIMDLAQPVNKTPYNKIQNEIETMLHKQAEIIMKEAASRLILKVCEDDPSSIELNESGEWVANVAVTVDGTWQKRGHASKIGVVFVLSVDTGEVLDYELQSFVCNLFVCNRSKKNEQEFNKWVETHTSKCCINHVFEPSSPIRRATELYNHICARNDKNYARKSWYSLQMVGETTPQSKSL